MTDTHQRLALRIQADGRFELIDWPQPGGGTLNTLLTAIGCRAVDAVTISADLTMWLDDEGIVTGLPVNGGATALYAAHQPPHRTYHGTVVITGGTDRHGDTLPSRPTRSPRSSNSTAPQESIHPPPARPPGNVT